MKKKNGFTLIELIAVLVILAILALIVTPLVMNIIRKARISADKRSIDAYGRSIELAIATYLLDEGKFPTSIDELTIEYSGDRVVCETSQLNSDSSVYLAGCKVAGRSVDGYAYGKEDAAPTYTAYSVGDKVEYNNVDYYVIKDSGANEEMVTLLKATLLSYSEVQTYSLGTEAHTYDNSDGGLMNYHASSNSYDASFVKTVVEVWKSTQAPDALNVRLLTYEELITNLGYELDTGATSEQYIPSESTPSWVYNVSGYWAMIPYSDSSDRMWKVSAWYEGSILKYNNISELNGVRPVITINKSYLN